MKRIIVFALAALVISVSACQQRSTGITEPSTPFTVDTTMPIQVQRTVTWVNNIDPYVTIGGPVQQRAYLIDERGFHAAYHPQGEDKIVADGLIANVAIANQQMLKANQGLSPEGIWVNYHWWGWTACFEGNAATNFIDIASAGVALIPGMGIYIAVPTWLGLKLYYNQHGGRFCLNFNYWNRSIWLSCC